MGQSVKKKICREGSGNTVINPVIGEKEDEIKG